jgi:TolB-like protein/AraC-like DNA-binding protein
MSEPGAKDKSFLEKITEIINENISDEQFGVSELAQKVGMSRSNLLRKVKSLTGKSVSQYIRLVRLERSIELLKDADLNISEIGFRVGFGSSSYFIKCFHEEYGYPPGEFEINNKTEIESDFELPTQQEPTEAIQNKSPFYWIGGIIITIVLIAFVWLNPNLLSRNDSDKSIAVLPFINDSSDSTNIHIINGLLESVLNNLQKIEDLRVVSRTSVEKYRNQPKNISEIAKELDVTYIVEGSGQKIDNQILLNIQLIEAQTDRHLWANQYKNEVADIFTLQ